MSVFLCSFDPIEQFEAEYRRFALQRNGAGGFTDFYHLLQTIHHIPGVDMVLGYADIQGDLLPINNDENFHKAVSSANPLLRIIITKKGETNFGFSLSILCSELEASAATSGWTQNCACRPHGLCGFGSKLTKRMPIIEA